MSERARTAMVVAISIMFVGLYFVALLGWLNPTISKDLIGYLQPVVWVIIGYYFGRVPAERVESRLKERADKSDAAADEANKANARAQARLAASESKAAAVRRVLRGVPPATGHIGIASAGAPLPAVGPSPASAALTILGQTCSQCVQGTIEDWAGSEVSGKGDVLADLYLAQHGPCDNGALRDLCDDLKARCDADISVSDLKCGMTVGDVVQVICG